MRLKEVLTLLTLLFAAGTFLLLLLTFIATHLR